MALDEKQIKAVQEASGHSVFGSSSLPRIIACPASVGMELRAGLRPSSIYAQKGTELHEITEKALRSDDPHKYIYSLAALEVEDTAYVIDAVDYVYEILGKHPEGATMELEARGSLSSYGIPDVYGTMDVVIKSDLRTDVIDHKFGHGVAVYAEKNYQLVSYLGMSVPFVPTPDSNHELYVHINQPPLNIYDDWRVDWDVLYQMILGDITDAITQAKSDDPKFGPNVKACRFCNANTGCKERHAVLMSQATMVAQMSKNPGVVSNEKWATFLEAAESLKAAISQVEKHAMTEIQSGNDFPGFKLISGRSNRKFMDPESANVFMEKRLGKKAFKKQEFISLAQAEKVDKSLKKDEAWKGMIHKPNGKAKLVSADAKGEALVYGVRGIMDDIAREDSKVGTLWADEYPK